MKVKEARQSDAAGDMMAEGNQTNRKAWMALFHEGANGKSKVDFAGIARWVKQELVSPDRESEMTAAALDGYLGAMEDPHTRLMPSRYFRDRQQASARHFTGIGVSLRGVRHGIVVQRVLEGGPAERAGMAVNDVLVRIDGEKVRRGPDR